MNDKVLLEGLEWLFDDFKLLGCKELDVLVLRVSHVKEANVAKNIELLIPRATPKESG